MTNGKPVRLGVVIPAGPNDDVADTLDSVLYYVEESRCVVVVNDTGRALSLPADPTVTVVPAPPNSAGSQGGLWVKIASGYRALYERCRAAMVLRLDADALVIGRGLESAAEQRFAEDAGVGLLGAYRVGPDGNRRGFGPAARLLATETGLLGLRHPRLRSHLRALVSRAGQTYEPGEHALGGAYIHSGAAVESMLQLGLLDDPVLAASGLGEDHLMALATVAAGYAIADFSGPGEPMAVKWRGLPASPDELVRGDALVTHSVRHWEDLGEEQIRGIFRRYRV
jgi:hypothetical protein